MPRRSHRLDGNHHEVRQALERVGYLFLDCSQTNLGFDALVVKAGRLVPVEIKDGRRAPSAQRLTPHEVEVHARLKAHGVTVEILTGVDQSLDVLLEPRRNFYDAHRNTARHT